MRKQLFRILTGLGATAVFALPACLIGYLTVEHPKIVAGIALILAVANMILVLWFIGATILED